MKKKTDESITEELGTEKKCSGMGILVFFAILVLFFIGLAIHDQNKIVSKSKDDIYELQYKTENNSRRLDVIESALIVEVSPNAPLASMPNREYKSKRLDEIEKYLGIEYKKNVETKEGYFKIKK